MAIGKTIQCLSEKPNKETLLYTVNDLLVQKALSSPDVPLLACPSSLKGIDDYVHYAARDLD
jgi:hypothetical protein